MIKKATPTISWSTPADISFGSALSPTQLNAIASVPGTLVYSPPAGTVLPVGRSQLLTVNFAPSDTADYNPASTVVSLNVDAISLTITADDASRQYGQNNPLFTVSYKGFVNGDSAGSLSGTLSCASMATVNSPVGTYPITCSGLSSTNYTITYAPGQLTVMPAALTITANNASRQFGQPNPVFGAAYNGFVNADTASSLSGTLSCGTTAVANSPVGNYPITCSGLSSTNYMIAYVAGQLTITPVPCAADVSSSVAITRSGFSYSPLAKRYAQTLTLTNNSAAPLTSPIYVVLDTLSSNASLWNAVGTTACSAPAGSPYVSTSTINPGATATVVLQFANPGNAAISYTLRVLAGAGPP